MADQCGYLSLESSGHILCENGDNLVTECFTPPAPSSSLVPGKVYKGEYPYWRNRVPYKPPYSRPQPNFAEEEELLILLGMDD